MSIWEQWRAAGEIVSLNGREIFVVDRPPSERERAAPVLVLHGFPTASVDWHLVVGAIGAERRVVLLDLLGFGFSEKPFDHSYSLFEQADIVQACAKAVSLEEAALLTHDMGNSVGGEILARSLEGTLGFGIERRVLANGSVYIQMAQLSAGQQMLLAMPDEPFPEDAAPGAEFVKPALAATFAPDHSVPDEELEAMWRSIEHGGGNRLGARLIRYIEERRVHEQRWTGAIESHPAPLGIVWGDADPIAVWAMAERLSDTRRDARLMRLRGVGHYPMVEASSDFARAVLDGLS